MIKKLGLLLVCSVAAAVVVAVICPEQTKAAIKKEAKKFAKCMRGDDKEDVEYIDNPCTPSEKCDTCINEDCMYYEKK